MWLVGRHIAVLEIGFALAKKWVGRANPTHTVHLICVHSYLVTVASLAGVCKLVALRFPATTFCQSACLCTGVNTVEHLYLT